MPTISIITPLHAPGVQYIQETYESLLAQTHQDWEWLLLENHGGLVPSNICADPRVRAWGTVPELEGVGALKRACCERATGDFIFELDADDLLHPTALQQTLDAFSLGADFVYSDVAEFKREFEPVIPYDPCFGWSSYLTAMPNGRVLNAMHMPPLVPQNMRYIYWAPNHLRAWRTSAYWDVGGHEAGMLVADDHDLVVRMYLAGKKFRHIPDALYYYRIHDLNTVKTRNAEIQAGTDTIYNRYIWKLAEKFCDDNGLLKVDLCSWKNTVPGYTGIDREDYGQEYIADLDDKWPFKKDSVGLVRAVDAIEHLRSPINTMNEAYRALAPGGFFLSDTPSTNGPGAFCDPTHVSFWNKLSFRYYTDQRFAAYIPAFKGRFQELRVQEHYPDLWCQGNAMPYVEAHLVAQKPGYRHYGGNGWWPENG